MNQQKKIKVCFIADKHGLYDDRIYWKMSLSLKKRGYEIYYLLIDDSEKKGTTKEGINYQTLKIEKFSKNRYINYIIKYSRLNNNYTKILQTATEINADVYHFHDLNINRIGKKLKLLSQKPIVIYDVRDPFAQNIKDYIGSESMLKLFINLFANYIDWWEKRNARCYDFVISNEENVRDAFRKVLPIHKVDVIYNYTYLHKHREDIQKEYDLIYCGGITKFRGAFKIIEAIKVLKEKNPDIKMIFLGNFFTKRFKDNMIKRIAKYDLKKNITLKDSVPYDEVIKYYNISKIGLGIFLPIETHKITLQIKIFEYMAMGLPIIGSNFGHINNYILNNEVGIPVDSTKPIEIANAVETLLNNKQLYLKYKENGIKAVQDKYSWSLMEHKLYSIYDKLLSDRQRIVTNEK